MAVDKKQMAFYAETADALTPCTDNNWMLLLIDADNDPSTGWYGYDYLIQQADQKRSDHHADALRQRQRRLDGSGRSADALRRQPTGKFPFRANCSDSAATVSCSISEWSDNRPT